MKTLTTTSKIIATLIIALSFSTATTFAQSAPAAIEFENIKSDIGTQWIGYKEIPYAKVFLTWQVAANAAIVRFEVECTFDMINYSNVGTVTEEFSSNEKMKTFKFEDASDMLVGKNIAQYRINKQMFKEELHIARQKWQVYKVNQQNNLHHTPHL